MCEGYNPEITYQANRLQRIREVKQLIHKQHIPPKTAGLLCDIAYNIQNPGKFYTYLSQEKNSRQRRSAIQIAERRFQGILWEQDEQLAIASGLSEDTQMIDTIATAFVIERTQAERIQVAKLANADDFVLLNQFGVQLVEHRDAYFSETTQDIVNCQNYIFGNDRQVHKGMHSIANSPEVRIPIVGDYIIHEDMNDRENPFRHIGRVIHIDHVSFGSMVIERSKWGVGGHVVDHPVGLVPPQYGEPKFVRIITAA